ncbi:MAG: hypothetical protein O2807_05855 [bacterium]|nr:hypothetical protein [bacterium]
MFRSTSFLAVIAASGLLAGCATSGPSLVHQTGKKLPGASPFQHGARITQEGSMSTMGDLKALRGKHAKGLQWTSADEAFRAAFGF